MFRSRMQHDVADVIPLPVPVRETLAEYSSFKRSGFQGAEHWWSASTPRKPVCPNLPIRWKKVVVSAVADEPVSCSSCLIYREFTG